MNTQAMGQTFGRVAAAACAIALLPGAAFAQCEQTGPFAAFTQPWRAWNNTVGFFFPDASSMIVDTDGDGTTGAGDPADTLYSVPFEAQTSHFITALSPTREFFVLVGGTPGPCAASNLTVRVYHLLPATGTMDLVHEDCLPCTVFEGPLFYDTGAQPPIPFPPPVTGQRIVLFRTGAGAPCNPSSQAAPLLRWYNMNTPGPGGIGSTDQELQPGINPNTMRVSPSGYQAFVQHDLTSNPADSDFDIINLCPGPFFGDVVPNQIGPPIDNYAGFPLPVASISSAGPSGVVLQMRVNSTVVYESTVTNCCSGAPTGACCINGGCVVTIQAQCGGTWTQGATCEPTPCPPPPVPNLSVTMTGPAMVDQQAFVDYVLTCRNSGGAPAQNVVVTDQLPTEFTFVSAGNGGVYDEGQHQVTWTIGTLAAQSGPQTLTLRAQAGCTMSYFTNYNYRISADGIFVSGSPPVTTGVTMAPAAGSVSGSVATTTTAGQPLLPGSVLHHEMTITNTSGMLLENIVAAGSAGEAANFTAFVNHGTGTLSFPFGSGNYIQWTGDLAPGQTTTIAFDSTISECISAWDSTTQLNHGGDWNVSTFCGALLGSFPTSQVFTIQPPLSASFGAAPQPGAVGPVVPGTPTYPSTMQFVRGTPVIDLTLSVSNLSGATVSAADISVPLPSSWSIADPPFVGAVPPGFSYDATSATVRFNGDVPAAGLAPVTIRVQPDSPENNSAYFTVQRQIQDPSCGVILAELELVNLPELPSGPVIMGVEKWYQAGVWIIRPGIDTEPSEYFNRAEIWRGLHKEPNGDIWLAGAPIFMFNPDTLNAATAPALAAFLEGLGLNESEVCDIAVDPTDGTLVLIVKSTTEPLVSPPALVRYDRSSSTCTLITRDPALDPTDSHADVLIDPAGTIYIANRQVLARIARSMPVPIPDGQVPTVPVPHPAYSFGAGAGTLTSQKVHAAAWSCDGEMILLHASIFEGGLNPENFPVTTTLYALSRYDPATNTITVAQPQLAANSDGQGFREWPAEFSPQLPLYAILEDSCIAAGEFAQTFVANNFYPFHCIYALDTASGAATPIEPAEEWHFRAAADLAYLHGACTSLPPCDPDVNCDGSVNGFDIESTEQAINGDYSNFCQTTADLNNDGAENGFDIETEEQRVNGAPC
ncbi:hypothetical protein PHYC_00248 [Phycisphaerales bacterium]|nr:hypothetical protein PHYC_00248 [Phycisphaerales bacterium]